MWMTNWSDVLPLETKTTAAPIAIISKTTMKIMSIKKGLFFDPSYSASSSIAEAKVCL